MGKYANKPMEELAAELAVGLARLKRGYVDNAESLLRILEPSQEYPFDFVTFRLTGYRGRRHDQPPQAMGGKGLRSDLQTLIIDICDHSEVRTSDYAEPVFDMESLARRYRVSTKTIQRWRRGGLPGRRLIFPDEKRRVAFLESSVQWFVGLRQSQIARSMRFTQMTPAEREDIIRRARRMAAFTQCCLSDVARRLAGRTGRAVETIRYTIRKHDTDHPEQAVFPYLLSPLDDQEKGNIYRSYLRGVSVPMLGERYRRTRGSIYRILNEMRARQLIERPIGCIYNPQFDLPNSDEVILGATASHPGERRARKAAESDSAGPDDLPPYLRALYDVPLLSAQEERDLFRRYNYLKYRADTLRQRVDMTAIRTRQLKQIETLLVQANLTKNQIINANLRLVVSIAKKHVGGAQTLFELISDGNVSLMRAVEKFDYSRGNRFSTYASWAIMRNFARSVPKERYQLDRFSTGNEEVLDITAGLQGYDPNEVNVAELRESIDVVLGHLSPMERTILVDHYGLDENGQVKTLEQLGQQLGVSKERVRQIEIQAMKKLRTILTPQEADMQAM